MAQTFTPDYPRELTMFGSIPRTGRVTLLWSVAMAVFLWALECAGHGPQPGHGLGVNLLYTLCLGYWGWTIIGIVWLGEARRRWPRLPDARQRYDRSGVYGLLGGPGIALVALLGVPLACVLGMFTAQAALMLPWPFAVGDQRLSLLVCLVLSYSLALGTFTLDYLRVHLVANQVRAQAAQRQAVEAQLQLLQAQLEPHMLFNTLANLHALIDADPTRAQDMLARLIAFLRATLSASRRSLHPLSEEFDHARDYLALMQVRMGPRLQITLTLPPDLADVPVPPMLVQPLLENAIQHGLEPKRSGGALSLSAHQDGEMLVLTVTDTGRGIEAAQADPVRKKSRKDARRNASGFGLSCVRDRLQSIYGGQASLQLSTPPMGVGTQAVLRLPLHVPPLSAGAFLPQYQQQAVPQAAHQPATLAPSTSTQTASAAGSAT
jgi:signal transduction histidine kinase